jgi:protein gp37
MPDLVWQYTAEIKRLVSRTAHDVVRIGELLIAVKQELKHGQWLDWLQREFRWSQPTASRFMTVANRFKSFTVNNLPIEPGALYMLAAKNTPTAFVEHAVEQARKGEVITQVRAKALIEDYRTWDGERVEESALELEEIDEPDDKATEEVDTSVDINGLPEAAWDPVTIEAIELDTPDEVPELEAEPEPPAVKAPALILTPPPVLDGRRSTFNRTNELVDWAKWSWNPVTGCLHDCVYCYARDLAQTLYPEKFEPTFRPERLKAPHWTKLPPEARDLSLDEQDKAGWRNVFVCSMADLFGKWVLQDWIDAVLDEVRAAPQWNFLFLTKFPQRLAQIDWPANAWVGTSVDRQYRVSIAEKAFRDVNAPVKWLSCEPLLEDLTFSSLAMFDWVVIGGQSESSQSPAFQPAWAWVKHLLLQAWQSDCLVYMKPNLTVRSQEYPKGQRPPGGRQREVTGA